jgi:hypothetical protein
MMADIKWNKSDDGYVSSKCGRFDIEPIFMGRTTAQCFRIMFRPPFTDKRVEVGKYIDTQRDAKVAAEDFLYRLAKETVTDYQGKFKVTKEMVEGFSWKETK